MDQRQQQITEGAGLTESRLNQDFIDWLNKWGPRFLTLILVVLVVYVGNTWWKGRQLESRDEAFFQLEQARISGSPDALLAVAREHGGRGAVAELATIKAADILLASARRGVAPGGSATVEEDLLAEEEQADLYRRAGDLYAQAFRATRSDAGRPLQRISARWGMAAVAISLRQWDDAKAALEDVARFSEQAGMQRLVTVARERLESLDDLRNARPLLPESEIATLTPRDPSAYGPSPSPLIDPDVPAEAPLGLDLLGPPTPLLPEPDEPPATEESGPQPAPTEETPPTEEPAPAQEPAPAEPPAGEPAQGEGGGEPGEAPPPRQR